MKYVDYDAWDGHDPDASWAAINRFLERTQHEHRERLGDELDRIADQLDERDEIHEEIVDELEWTIERYTDQLKHLYNTGTGKQDGEREWLKDRLTTVQEKLRTEHREHWRDRQELERERRNILRELAELDDEDLSELL
jgi:hypothetical protein